MTKINELKYNEIIKLLQQNEISCKKLVEEALNQIDKYDKIIESYISTFDKKELIKQAEESDKRWKNKKPLSLIDGIPIAVKDNIHVKGINTTCGSKILKNYNPPFNATVTELMNANGGIIIGKTNLDEFAMGSTTETSAFLHTKNPWNPNKVAGGSSGGSAAAVSTGMAVLALGSDTGGSIRQPASFCGVFGIKPTYGLVSRYGLVAYASSLDQIGPISNDLYGLAVLLNTISGFDKNDSTSINTDKKDYTKLIGKDIKNKKIAVFPDLYKEGISNEVQEQFLKILEILKNEGVIVEEVSFPALKYVISTYYFIATAEASSNLSRYDGVKYGYRSPKQENYEQMLDSTRSNGFGKEVKKRILLGNFVLSSGYYDEYYRKAQKIRKYIMDELKKVFIHFDAVAMPATPDTAFNLNESIKDPLKMYLSDVTTVIANLAGVPAISIPAGLINDMPIGLQLIGRPLEEDVLFQISKKITDNINTNFIPDLEKLKNFNHSGKKIKANEDTEQTTVIYSKDKIKEISDSYNNRTKTFNRVLCNELKKQVNKSVCLSGWIHKINSLGGIEFFILRDRTGMTQLVIESNINTDKITPETVVEINGLVTKEERSPYDNIEIKVRDIKILSYANNNLPINIYTSYDNINLPTILDNRPLSIRNTKTLKIFKIQSEIVRLFSEYLRKNNFTEIKTPKLISSGTEGGTNIFEVKYFEKSAFLAQSPQFYKQIMVGSGFERVFEIGPVFRAEIHNTVRHLNEYTSMDFEMGFIKDEQDIIDMQEGLIKYIFNEIIIKHKEILDEFNAEIKMPDKIPRLHFLDALSIAEKSGISDMDGDISPEGERAICDFIEKEKNSSFVYVVGYPMKKRPMYTMPDENLPGYSRSFDLLFKGLEITTGGQRIHDYNMLKKSMKKKGFNPSEFKDYLQCFEYGMPPHGGLGMGLERITMKLLNLKNVREATLFPRDRNRISP